MESVVLVIHLILALSLIGVVLMQKSEGGGLGMGSGGGGNGLVSARGAATALGKITWGLAGAFIVTSLALTIIAKQNSTTASVIDAAPAATEAAPVEAPAAETPALPGLGNDLLPPAPAGQ